MASHTPQESQAPERQEPQLPDEPGVPDSAPADHSIPDFPGLLEQEAALIPTAVYGVAQATGLGNPIRAYTRKQPPLQQWIIALLKNPDLWLSILGLWVMGILLTILLHVSLPLNLIIVGILLIAFQPFALLIVQARVAVHRQRRRSNFLAWSCPNGLIYRKDEHYHAVRWEQIEIVIRKMIPLNDVHATVGFLVLPIGAPPFEFALLQGSFAEYLQSLGKKRAFTLTVSNAEQSIRLLQVHRSMEVEGETVYQEEVSVEVSGKVDLSAYAGLGELIEEQMISQHWPRVLAAYRSGAGIAFGSLMINQQGLTEYNETLAWDELAGVKMKKGVLQIMKKPGNTVWDDLPALTTPNLALLLTLLRRVRNGEMEALVR